MFMKTEGQAEFMLSKHPKALRLTRRVALGSLGDPEVSTPFRGLPPFSPPTSQLCCPCTVHFNCGEKFFPRLFGLRKSHRGGTSNRMDEYINLFSTVHLLWMQTSVLLCVCVCVWVLNKLLLASSHCIYITFFINFHSANPYSLTVRPAAWNFIGRTGQQPKIREETVWSHE